MNSLKVTKTREEVLAEREARKLAKQAAKKVPEDDKEKKEKHVIFADETKGGKIVSAVYTVPSLKRHRRRSSGSESSDHKEGTSPPTSCGFLTKKLNTLSIAEGQVENAVSAPFVESEAGGVKSKAQLRAERRAKQEMQRALKAAQKCEKHIQPESGVSKPEKLKTVLKKQAPSAANKEKVATAKDTHRVKLFSHLYKSLPLQEIQSGKEAASEIHPAVAQLASQCQSKRIIGSNARCIAFLNALQQMIRVYKSPADKDFSRSLEVTLAGVVSYLECYRPLSVSMTNALKHLKWHITQLPNSVSDNEAQIKLQEVIDNYIKEQIDIAGKAIYMKAQEKISDGDVILTYSYSSLIERILLECWRSGRQFRVVVVDSGPLYEGKKLLQRLAVNQVPCIYILLSATSYIMKQVTKVLLGAHALLANGYVMSRAGSSQVALIADSCNVPVLVCCETYKFSERVQMDAFVSNELGDPENVMPKKLWESNDFLTPLSLMYDVTPSSLVSAVITELAILPCTSVPVVLRVKPTESTLV